MAIIRAINWFWISRNKSTQYLYSTGMDMFDVQRSSNFQGEIDVWFCVHIDIDRKIRIISFKKTKKKHQKNERETKFKK